MAYSHVAHDCMVGNQCVLANDATLGGHVELGDWVIMGGFSGIHQFCKVGAHAFIANNAAVTRDVPPYVMAVGQPASRAQRERRGAEAPRLHARADPQHPQRLPRAVPLGAQARRCHEELEALAKEQPELRAFVEFLPLSTRSILR